MLLNVQNPQLTPSLTVAATDMCVLTAAIGRDPQSVYPETHMCMPTAASGRPTLGLVCAHSSNWSAKPHVTYDQKPSFGFILHQRRVCSQQLLVMCMPTAAIGRPALDPWMQLSIALSCNTHVCVLTAAIWFAKVVECSTPSADSLIDFCCNTHVFSHQQWVGQASIGLFCNTYVCVCSQQQLVCQSY